MAVLGHSGSHAWQLMQSSVIMMATSRSPLSAEKAAHRLASRDPAEGIRGGVVVDGRLLLLGEQVLEPRAHPSGGGLQRVHVEPVDGGCRPADHGSDLGLRAPV